jgi:Family of unknown function (DUF6535)
MWALCILHANEHDAAMVTLWKADMDGILIYVSMLRSLSMALSYLNKTVLRPVFSL